MALKMNFLMGNHLLRKLKSTFSRFSIPLVRWNSVTFALASVEARTFLRPFRGRTNTKSRSAYQPPN